MNCGLASAVLNSGVPQDGQNRRCIVLPLAAMLVWSAVVPLIVTASAGKQALTVPLPAPRYWHSRHQQTRVVIGAAVLRNRTLPHKQPPVISTFASACTQ